jgi:hypothetical protein
MHLGKTLILRRLRFAGFVSSSPMALLARITTMQRFTLALVLLLTSLCVQLFGQASATGAVNGTVTDPSGQVVAGGKGCPSGRKYQHFDHRNHEWRGAVPHSTKLLR